MLVALEMLLNSGSATLKLFDLSLHLINVTAISNITHVFVNHVHDFFKYTAFQKSQQS